MLRARIYRDNLRILPVQRQPPARRPAHYGTHPAQRAARRIARPRRAHYLPLSFVMSDDDGLFIILSGAVVVALLELVSGPFVPDDVDGGVAVPDDEVDDGALGLIDDVDDDEPVLGGVVVDEEDDDGDGVTTGGVVDEVVFDSRWQPETPSAMPVQSNVTRAALLIVISRSG